MSDEAVMVKGTGTLYLGGPLLVKVCICLCVCRGMCMPVCMSWYVYAYVYAYVYVVVCVCLCVCRGMCMPMCMSWYVYAYVYAVNKFAFLQLKVSLQQIILVVVTAATLTQAATGETIGPEELGGADIHCGISGCTDHWAGDEEEAFQITRRVVSSLNLPRNVAVNRTEPG